MHNFRYYRFLHKKRHDYHYFYDYNEYSSTLSGISCYESDHYEAMWFQLHKYCNKNKDILFGHFEIYNGGIYIYDKYDVYKCILHVTYESNETTNVMPLLNQLYARLK